MSGKRRSSDEWQRLLAEFEAGDESPAEFCRGRGISSSNFYKRRTSHTAVSSSAFVAARRTAPSAAPVTVQVNEVVIRCDMQTPVSWVSDLVAALRG